MTRSYMKFSLYSIIVFAMLVISIAGFNFAMDPFWMFGHQHRFNQLQDGFDERLMKTNRITFQPTDFDTLLVGNSRTTFIYEKDFTTYRVFNFATVALPLAGYEEVIDYATQIKGEPIETIILGIEYFNAKDEFFNDDREGLQNYIRKTKVPLYTIKSLLSLDMLKQSTISLSLSVLNTNWSNRLYTHDFKKINVDQSLKINQRNIDKAVRLYREKYENGMMDVYDENFKTTLLNLKANHPQSRFIIYTPPVAAALLDEVKAQEGLEDYKRWLRETLEVFGEVHHFMYDHSVTRDPMNYRDGSHFKENVGKMIALRLSGEADSSIPDDFGMMLTQDNLEAYLETLK